MIFDGRILTTFFMLSLFVLAIIFALFLPQKSAFVPLLVAIPGLVLCAMQLIMDIRDYGRQMVLGQSTGGEAAGQEIEQDGELHKDARSEFEMFFWLGGYLIFLLCFGFIVGGTIMNLLFVRFNSRESWLNAMFAGGGTFAVLYGIFIWVLELSLFNGLILEKFL